MAEEKQKTIKRIKIMSKGQAETACLVEPIVMPIILGDGMLLKGKIYLHMLREDLAIEITGKTLNQLADSGGITPSTAIAIKDHLWGHVNDENGMEILNHCLKGGWK